ncbi:MAG TPA: class I SAM-dependent methyltransferase [Pedococcus sp.]|nr:class I SAM-dependent methyltransferase [Pedococcus sp.]
MSAEPVRTSSPWLQLREPADAAARSPALASHARRLLPQGRPVVIHDLGCGTGAMMRWLAPQLPGPQHWVLYDRDEELLDLAMSGPAPSSAGGTPVTRRPELLDLTGLQPADLAGASLVTASALVDLLTEAEVQHLVAACLGAGCPVLVMLSVVGDVRLRPSHRLDGPLNEAFNQHQQRTVNDRTLVGPQGVELVGTGFAQAGLRVLSRSSDWNLDATQSSLSAEWLTGWTQAASEQAPHLAAPAAAYLRRRLDQAYAGQLQVTVGHRDLLAVPE